MKKIIQEGLILVISAPSGTGKTTLSKKLIKTIPNTYPSISATTRLPRKGEVHGKDYFFITVKEFKKKIQNKSLLEWVRLYDYYGTPKEYLLKSIREGKNIVLDIDVRGGKSVKKHFPQSVLIFIAPPSFKELRNRLLKRNKDDSTSIKKCLSIATQEMQQMKYYDYCIINDNLDRAFHELKSIVLGEQRKVKRLISTIEKMISWPVSFL